MSVEAACQAQRRNYPSVEQTFSFFLFFLIPINVVLLRTEKAVCTQLLLRFFSSLLILEKRVKHGTVITQTQVTVRGDSQVAAARSCCVVLNESKRVTCSVFAVHRAALLNLERKEGI